MGAVLECRKVKRSGFFPAFLTGGILAALVPVINMAARTEMYTGQQKPPLEILMDANWEMMGMLNLFLLVIGACILYHLEYADNAIQKMEMLPVSMVRHFFGKAAVLAAALLGVYCLEGISFLICAWKWFGMNREAAAPFLKEVLENIGFLALLLIPAIIFMTGIASACRNMWISLGIGVICLFMVMVFPKAVNGDSPLMLFPFIMPFRVLYRLAGECIVFLLSGAAAEILVFSGFEILYLKRRNLQ